MNPPYTFGEVAAFGGLLFCVLPLIAVWIGAPDVATAELWCFHGFTLGALWSIVSGLAELRALFWRWTRGLERPPPEREP